MPSTRIFRLGHVAITSLLPLAVSRFADVTCKCPDVATIAAILTGSSAYLSTLGTHTLINSFVSPAIFLGLAQAIRVLHTHREEYVRSSGHAKQAVNHVDLSLKVKTSLHEKPTAKHQSSEENDVVDIYHRSLRKKLKDKQFPNAECTNTSTDLSVLKSPLMTGYNQSECDIFYEPCDPPFSKTCNEYSAFEHYQPSCLDVLEDQGYKSRSSSSSSISTSASSSSKYTHYDNLDIEHEINLVSDCCDKDIDDLVRELSQDTSKLSVNSQHFSNYSGQKEDPCHGAFHLWNILGGVLLSVAVYIRPDASMLVSLALLGNHKLSSTGSLLRFPSAWQVAVGGAIGLGVAAANDAVFYGAPVLTPINWIRLNLFSNTGKRLFGVLGGYFYLNGVFFRDLSMCVASGVFFAATARSVYEWLAPRQKVCVAYNTRVFGAPLDTQKKLWHIVSTSSDLDTTLCMHYLSKQQDITGLFIDRNIKDTGGYSILHKNIPLLYLFGNDFVEFTNASLIKEARACVIGANVADIVKTSSIDKIFDTNKDTDYTRVGKTQLESNTRQNFSINGKLRATGYRSSELKNDSANVKDRSGKINMEQYTKPCEVGFFSINMISDLIYKDNVVTLLQKIVGVSSTTRRDYQNYQDTRDNLNTKQYRTQHRYSKQQAHHPVVPQYNYVIVRADKPFLSPAFLPVHQTRTVWVWRRVNTAQSEARLRATVQSMLQHGAKHGAASGYTEDKVPTNRPGYEDHSVSEKRTPEATPNESHRVLVQREGDGKQDSPVQTMDSNSGGESNHSDAIVLKNPMTMMEYEGETLKQLGNYWAAMIRFEAIALTSRGHDYRGKVKVSVLASMVFCLHRLGEQDRMQTVLDECVTSNSRDQCLNKNQLESYTRRNFSINGKLRATGYRSSEVKNDSANDKDQSGKINMEQYTKPCEVGFFSINMISDLIYKDNVVTLLQKIVGVSSTTRRDYQNYQDTRDNLNTKQYRTQHRYSQQQAQHPVVPQYNYVIVRADKPFLRPAFLPVHQTRTVWVWRRVNTAQSEARLRATVQSMLQHGAKHGAASGYTEDKVPTNRPGYEDHSVSEKRTPEANPNESHRVLVQREGDGIQDSPAHTMDSNIGGESNHNDAIVQKNPMIMMEYEGETLKQLGNYWAAMIRFEAIALISRGHNHRGKVKVSVLASMVFCLHRLGEQDRMQTVLDECVTSNSRDQCLSGWRSTLPKLATQLKSR
ncbi:hypothetical protein EGW08_021560 [Elysia chlorotica]|uniref:Uncharacterized protein n=1 Tax=Elysia chlorotica TaxID=188477 RepID=A0A433SNB6_ELYCH|nr:hypothetical protein EGW08_021560 [Elysia chlorotica]